MLQATLKKLFDYQTLSSSEAREVLVNIAGEVYSRSEVVAFLSVFMMRPVTVEELTGFRDALLELCLTVNFAGFETIDLCGTGGDGKNTFNISTLASLVVAGAGIKVAKHGNYGVSSGCGSSNVMEYLGYRFTTDNDLLKQQLHEAGICFLHAPLFHPAMKAVAPIRRELGIKTFFNMLGPMVNPSNPGAQLVGVFNLELARLYQYIYQSVDKRFTIIHSVDGYDEVTLTAPFKVITRAGEKLMSASDLNLPAVNPKALEGGRTVEESAGIFMEVARGKGTDEQNNVVIANAAVAIHCFYPNRTLGECVVTARESLLSGKALGVLTTLLKSR